MSDILCPKCGKVPAVIHSIFGVVWCTDCQAKAENYHHGKPLNLTESSDRIKKQREQMHDDLLQPHTYNKNSKKMEVNPEFVRVYPDRAGLYYTEQEMKQAGMPGLVSHVKEVSRKEAVEKKKIEAYKERVMAARSDPEQFRRVMEGFRR